MTEEMGGADYSDYKYQHFQTEVTATNPNNNPQVTGVVNFDPVSTEGGLEQNEVAELVYYDLDVSIEYEKEASAATKASFIEQRGILGANLPLDEDFSLSRGQNNTDTNEVDVRASDSGINVDGQTLTDDRIFQLFQTRAGAAFESTDGGSSGHHQVTQYRKNYRDLTGRGPVLDSTDDISLFQSLNAGNVVENVEGQVRGTLVWDIAEVSDAGRAFSVPDM